MLISDKFVIGNWKLEGSNDDSTWTQLYRGMGDHISTSQQFTLYPELTANKYSYFRIYFYNAYDPYSGLSMFQIYTLDDLV